MKIIKESYKTISLYVEAEPGDATRYRFIIQLLPDDWVRVAGAPDMVMYEYEKESIIDFHKRREGTRKDLDDYYIQYISSHSRCNLNTALAFLNVMKEIYSEEK